MLKCDKCKEYKLSISPNCKCREFIIIDEDGGEHNIYANNEKKAAELFAKQSSENGENYLLNSSSVVSINDTKYRISAEAEIEYYASKIV